jgi:RNA polymerase sigma-70 factor (ECF subfamily)
LQTAVGVTPLSPAIAGGEKDFEDLILPLTEAGYRLACAMLHDPQAAQDAVQEASLRAWRKLPGVRDRGRLRPWFLGIVVNECRNSRRLKWVAGVTLGLPAELSIASAEEKVLQGADLRRAVSQLDTRDRLVVVLFFFVDLPLEEVAAVVGTSVGATRARLYRAVKRLRPDLGIQEALQ